MIDGFQDHRIDNLSTVSRSLGRFCRSPLATGFIRLGSPVVDDGIVVLEGLIEEPFGGLLGGGEVPDVDVSAVKPRDRGSVGPIGLAHDPLGKAEETSRPNAGGLLLEP